jgi:[glutamine synthetase] adenylyltransferase / [glutamine synthetase]-adenylyl-L-tyrosine phosphorylase
MPHSAAQPIAADSAGSALLSGTWPRPSDAPAGERLVERFAELGRAEARLVRDPAMGAMLMAIGGNAPFLADLAIRESAILRQAIKDGPDAVVAGIMAGLAGIAPTLPRAQLAARLRGAKRAVALLVALADIGGLWPLDKVTAALADLAEAALSLSVAHLLRAAHDAGELTLPDRANPAQACGFTVLGMGKLGARELNYSSDVDVILIHDPGAGVYHGDAPVAFYTRMARGLVTLMEARDPDGYVFRTDLRLRPDPAATPSCIALPAAIAYYESMGQNWERAAMLKARPVAGDLALGHSFLEAIRPFVWRRHLDFAAVADIHAMKRRIDDHKGNRDNGEADPVVRLLGHNVKLGHGGIREIEFLAQSLQLVWGGRDPTLRVLRTMDALRLLVRSGHVPRRTAGELAGAYRFLRRVEHRLQMVQDRQTHSLPEKPEQMETFATFMGHDTAAAFAAALLRHMDRVRTAYGAVFEQIPEMTPAAAGLVLDFRGVGEAPRETMASLTGLGFKEIERIVAAVRAWKSGRIRALRSPRAQELMDQMLPAILAALARQAQPDAAFSRWDSFLARLPAGVQLLSLFQHNPALLERIAGVLGAAPMLSDYLARTPGALEGLLDPAPSPDFARMLRLRLGDARVLEDVISIIRATVREEEFSLAVATMEGRLDVDAAGHLRSALAEAALAALLPLVLEDFARRFGRVRGGGLALVIMGKAGGREMMAGSDLDMMLVYDHPATVSQSTARAPARPLPASQWFIRAVHAYVAAVTAPDAEGPMFAVDMRLRPSGNKGPVAVSLAAFERYHGAAGATEGGAWTWERMALTRARVIAGPPRLRARVEAAIETAIAGAGDPTRIRADAAAMRARLLRDLPPTGCWDVKLRRGGQIEVEFIAQVLQLAHAADVPSTPTTREALARLRDEGVLTEAEADLLSRADRLWRTVQGMLRITYGRQRTEKLSEAATAALLRAANAAGAAAVDVGELHATFATMAEQVRASFARHVGEIDG